MLWFTNTAPLPSGVPRNQCQTHLSSVMGGGGPCLHSLWGGGEKQKISDHSMGRGGVVSLLYKYGAERVFLLYIVWGGEYLLYIMRGLFSFLPPICGRGGSLFLLIGQGLPLCRKKQGPLEDQPEEDMGEQCMNGSNVRT